MIEQVICEKEGVAECAVVAMSDDLKGEVPCAFVVLKNSIYNADEMKNLIYQSVRGDIGPFSALKKENIYFVPRLPKTRSGKIVRKLIKHIVNGHLWEMPATIDDGGVPYELESFFKKKRAS